MPFPTDRTHTRPPPNKYDVVTLSFIFFTADAAAKD